jgi:O-antigen/teichoic acid export membrane protein
VSADTQSGSIGKKAYFRATLVTQACALLRYVVLARMLGPEQLGIAATLILTSQFLESISDGGGDRFLVQDRDGDKPRVQRLVHLMALARGLFMAVALVVLSGPLAHFYHRPELGPAFIALAISPLIGGFLHFDLRRMQRRHDFSREASVMLIGELVGLAATIIAAFLTHDFTAVIWGMTARSLTLVVASWRVAERRYAAGYSAEYARRLAAFAMPLMANGILLFFGAQGDRLLISNRLGVAELGHYSAVLLLVLYPSQVLSRFIQAIQLPLLASVRDDPVALRSRMDTLSGQALVLAVAQTFGFAVVAPFAVPLLYGPAFGLPTLVIALIGILQAHRFIRLWPTVEALAVGRSTIVLGNNLIRLSAIPMAIWGMALLGGLVGLILGLVIGEVVAFIAAVVLSNRAAGLAPFTNFSRVLAFTVTCAVVGLAAWSLIERPAIAAAAWAAALFCVGAVMFLERRLLYLAITMVLDRLRRRPKVAR